LVVFLNTTRLFPNLGRDLCHLIFVGGNADGTEEECNSPSDASLQGTRDPFQAVREYR
jgi:hypothetical protein